MAEKNNTIPKFDKINYFSNEFDVTAEAVDFLNQKTPADPLQLVHHYYDLREHTKATLYKIEALYKSMQEVFDILTDSEIQEFEDDVRIIKAKNKIAVRTEKNPRLIPTSKAAQPLQRFTNTVCTDDNIILADGNDIRILCAQHRALRPLIELAETGGERGRKALAGWDNKRSDKKDVKLTIPNQK